MAGRFIIARGQSDGFVAVGKTRMRDQVGMKL